MLQMVAERPRTDAWSRVGVVALAAAHTNAMLDFIAATNPGRFCPRMPLLGTYLGIREGDRLVAMAGERMRLRGYVEPSAISTHPSARRRGYAARLTAQLMGQALDRGKRSFLHVRFENTATALRYEALGRRVPSNSRAFGACHATAGWPAPVGRRDGLSEQRDCARRHVSGLGPLISPLRGANPRAGIGADDK
jgi:GNAT superfamily N-acetyltransferase